MCSGLSSGTEGTLNKTNRRATLIAPHNAVCGFLRCSSTSRMVTTSNDFATNPNISASILTTVSRSTPPRLTAAKSPALLSLESIAVTGTCGNAASSGQRKVPRPLPTSSSLSGDNPRSIPSTRCTRGSSAFTLNLCRRNPATMPSCMVALSPSRPRTNAFANSVKYRSMRCSQDTLEGGQNERPDAARCGCALA